MELCNSKEDRTKIQEEINADITVYRTQYNNLLFVVYDSNGFITDKEGFIRGLTEANPNTCVIVPIR